MSKQKGRNLASREAGRSAPITALTNLPPAESSQEKTMETSTEALPVKTAEAPTATAKQMAEMEELNAARAIKLAQQAAEPPPEPQVNVIEVASRGYDALHDAFRQHAARSKPKEYVPPPRTARQMAALEEELEAGRRAGERAAAQQAAARPPAPDAANKEGFTTPVYRPNDVVPDPIEGGMKKFGKDA